MTFKFSGLLLRFVDYSREITVDAGTLDEAVARLVSQHAALKNTLCDAEGKIRPVHRLFLNGEMVDGSRPELPLSSSDSIEILSALAGG